MTDIHKKWAGSRKLYGSENEIITACGRKVSGRYVLVEYDAATPSHNPTLGFQKSEGFPSDTNGHTVNDRDYERDRDAQSVTRNIARSYDSRALQSPVIVSRDGIVLSGNGRTMAGIIAARDNTDAAYVSHLAKFSSQYGFSLSDVESFSHPRLLFEVSDDFPYTAETFAMFNAQEMKSQSKTEQAVKLGKLVPDETFRRIILSINTFDTICDFYNNVKAATEAIKELLSADIVSQMQYAEMFDGDAISSQARELLENVLIGKAFAANPDAVRQITAFRGVRKNIITALAEISNNIALSPEYSLEEEMAQAISLVYQARQCGYHEGEAVSAFARQTVLFSDDSSETIADYRNMVVLILADIINHSQVTRLKKVFALYNQPAKEASSGQLDIFSGEVQTKQEILEDVVKAVCNASVAEINQAVRKAANERKTEAKKVMEQKDFEGDAGRILQTLRSFGVKVEGVTSRVGSTLTLYEVTPSVGTRISKIRNLKDEMAIALAVPSVRIIAPMDNGTIGIEVPNRKRSVIPVSDILESPEYRNTDMELPIAIGQTVKGETFMADLAEMPHLLVAGATGQGKSVCLNVMLMSLLGKKSPESLKLLLIDPKRVELNLYSKIEESYLAAPIVTDTDEAMKALDAVCELMEDRYELLSSVGVRNIKEYNEISIVEKMPYIVVVIDEYGDLIMTSVREMERTICRIAQKARAVGIHLIISTQRPDTKIVTGNIKANFPTRIAFRTTTSVDSRVILGQSGAEKLTGKGDMIFFNGDGTTRIQCAYASVDDVNAVCMSIQDKYAGCQFSPLLDFNDTTVVLSHPLLPNIKESIMAVSKQNTVTFDSLRWILNSTFGIVVYYEESAKLCGQMAELGIIQKIGYGKYAVVMHDESQIARILEKFS